MTTITHGPDGQPRFDGMTVAQVADLFDWTLQTLSDSLVEADGAVVMHAAAAALRHLSDRVAHLEGRPLTMEGFTDADIAAIREATP